MKQGIYSGASMIRAKCTTFSEQARAYIKECLLNGTLRPGDPIKESQIAETLGISRGPVRDALMTLQQEGLVMGSPQKCRHIRAMTAREIEESYFLGGTLEGVCIVLALPHVTKADFAGFEEILAQMKRESQRVRGLSALSDIDETFHDALMAKCHNTLMMDVARKACSHISKFLYYKAWDTLFTPAEFYERHKIILDAVKSKDTQLIEFTLREHYLESGRRLAREAVDGADAAAGAERTDGSAGANGADGARGTIRKKA